MYLWFVMDRQQTSGWHLLPVAQETPFIYDFIVNSQLFKLTFRGTICW